MHRMPSITVIEAEAVPWTGRHQIGFLGPYQWPTKLIELLEAGIGRG